MEKHSQAPMPPEPAQPQHEHPIARRAILTGLAVVGTGLALKEAFTQNYDLVDGEVVVPHVTMKSKPITTPTDMLKAGPWDYMSGAKQLLDGSVELTPVGASIVNKRDPNKKRHDNPGMNIFGPCLHVEGDFMVNGTIDAKTPVSLQVYGAPPLRFDDVRIEQSRIELLTAGNVLSIRMWDGSSQEPVVQTLTFDGPTTKREVGLRCEGDKMTFLANGNVVAEGGGANHIFRQGTVWFGANSEQGTAKLTKLTAGPINGQGGRLVDASTIDLLPYHNPNGTLRDNLKKPGFYFGAAFSPEFAIADPQYAQIMFGGDVDHWTTENWLKPGAVQPQRGVFDFSGLDITCELAKRFGKTVHGHALLYTKALPKWMEDLPPDPDLIRKVIWTHVTTVVKHAKELGVKSYDVVNEVLTGYGKNARLDTDNIFYKALGEEWIDLTFRAAYDADPEGEFWINDNGIETNRENQDLLFGLVERMIARGVPIHGIGDQCHAYKLPRDTIKPRVLINMAQRAHKLGLLFAPSELDVTGDDKAAQQDQIVGVVGTSLNIPNCPGVTMWGLFDKYGSTSELENNKIQPGNALLYTADGRAKGTHRVLRRVIGASRGFYNFS